LFPNKNYQQIIRKNEVALMSATAGLHESLVAGTEVLPVLCIKKVGWIA